MRALSVSAAAAALLLSACATTKAPQGALAAEVAYAAAPKEPTEPPALRNAEQSTTGDPDRVICRTQPASGTRIAMAKICKTARDWEAQRIGARDELDRHQRPQPTR